MDRIELEKSLPVPAAEAIDVFWDIERWHRIWKPIQQVVVAYDDGRLQEFEMALFWQDGPITIRTVRLRGSNGDIEFFSPNPPGEFSYHTGSWRFLDLGQGRCRVSAVREFIVRRDEDETAGAYDERKEKVRAAFSARLVRILDAFHTYAVHGF